MKKIRILILFLSCVISSAALSNEPNYAIFKIALDEIPQHLDPHQFTKHRDIMLLSHIYMPLINIEYEQQYSSKRVILKPSVITSWERVTRDTWRFEIRDDLVYADGTPITIDDVVLNIARALRAKGRFSYYTGEIRINKTNEKEFFIKSLVPNPRLNYALSSVLLIAKKQSSIFAKISQHSASDIIASGPYKVAGFNPGEYIKLTHNPLYAGDISQGQDRNIEETEGDDLSLISRRMDFVRISEIDKIVNALRDNKIDMIGNLQPDAYRLLREDVGVNITSTPSLRMVYLQLDQFRSESPYAKALIDNVDVNPLQDKSIRFSISHSINRTALAKTVYKGLATPAFQPIPSDFEDHFEMENNLGYTPSIVTDTLDLTDFANQIQFKLHVAADSKGKNLKLAQELSKMLADVEIPVSVEAVPKNQFFQLSTRGDKTGAPAFSLSMHNYHAWFGDSYNILLDLLHTFDRENNYGSINRGRYSNQQLDELVELVATERYPEKAQSFKLRALKIAMEDYAIIPLLHINNAWATQEKFFYKPHAFEGVLAKNIYFR